MELAARPFGAATKGLLPAGCGDNCGSLRRCLYRCRRLISELGAVVVLGDEAFERAADRRLPARACQSCCDVGAA